MLIKHPSATPVTTRNGVRSEVWNLLFGFASWDHISLCEATAER